LSTSLCLQYTYSCNIRDFRLPHRYEIFVHLECYSRLFIPEDSRFVFFLFLIYSRTRPVTLLYRFLVPVHNMNWSGTSKWDNLQRRRSKSIQNAAQSLVPNVSSFSSLEITRVTTLRNSMHVGSCD
jgi:hypothetical protein